MNGLLQRSQTVRVIGDDQKVERPGQFGLDPGGGRHLFAHRKAKRLFRAKAHAQPEGVRRVGRVQVRITEINLVRIFGQLHIGFGFFTRNKIADLTAGGQRQTKGHCAQPFARVHLHSPISLCCKSNSK